jgi:cytochrome c-type biogenesis protein
MKARNVIQIALSLFVAVMELLKAPFGEAFGMLSALPFCPTSAALFPGSLVPLSLKWQSGIVLPSLYGIGTAIPVFAFALVVVAGTRSADRWFDRVIELERWGRRITGVIFLLAGVCFSFTYIFQSSSG